MTPEQILDWLWSINVRGTSAQWTFESSPVADDLVAQVRAWVKDVPTPGLCLYGKAGVGKTGLMVAAVRAYLLTHRKIAETRDDGCPIWRLSYGDLHIKLSRQRPETMRPVWFEAWRDIARELHKVTRRHRDDEDDMEDPLDALIGTELLAVDDLDTGTPNKWKEEVVLLLMDRVGVGGRMILSLNHSPIASVDQLGQRVADRLLDDRVWTRIEVLGPSKRIGKG